jgi:hypothetical protein
VDLEQLVEEAIDGSWIGYCARTSAIRESEIGSVYAPAMEQRSSSVMAAPASSKHVEIIVDIDRREGVSPSGCSFLLTADFRAGMDFEVRQRWYSKGVDESFWKQPEVYDCEYD